MKLLLIILGIVGVLIVAITAIVGAAIYFSGPRLPDDIDGTIDGVLQSELPELLKGETGYVYPRTMGGHSLIN